MKRPPEDLLERAKHARQFAYAPYSKFLVGAAVLDENGNVHEGCNVENAAYPLGMCAEANAIGSMIAAGGHKIRLIAIAGSEDRIESCTPCGACRQRIAEFADNNTQIIQQDENAVVTTYSCSELLPQAFSLSD